MIFSWKNYNKEEERNYNRNRLLIKRGKIFIFPHEPDPPLLRQTKRTKGQEQFEINHVPLTPVTRLPPVQLKSRFQTKVASFASFQIPR